VCGEKLKIGDFRSLIFSPPILLRSLVSDFPVSRFSFSLYVCFNTLYSLVSPLFIPSLLSPLLSKGGCQGRVSTTRKVSQRGGHQYPVRPSRVRSNRRAGCGRLCASVARSLLGRLDFRPPRAVVQRPEYPAPPNRDHDPLDLFYLSHTETAIAFLSFLYHRSDNLKH
jgi:hypothetical protein